MSFRRRSRVSESSGNDHRFVIGLGVFIFVALLFPWYAYEVVSYSLERDTIKALNQFGIECYRFAESSQANHSKLKQSREVYKSPEFMG